MSRTEKIILWATGVVLVLTVLFQTLTPEPMDWRETYFGHSRDPFACALVRERLEDIFPKGVTTVTEPIYVTAEERAEQGALGTPVVHLFVNDGFHVDSLDLDRLLSMVQRGDEAFIACEWFDEALLDTLHVGTGYRWGELDSLLRKGPGMLLHGGDTSTLRFTCAPLRTRSPFLFAKGGMGGMFKRFPLDSTQVLAVNGRNEPVLLRITWGEGHLYLCSTPQAFTNYYLLKDEARGFMESALALLPDRPVLWDEYYKVGRLESTTPMRYVLKQPALKAAYWTTVVLLALYVFVYARRRQRAIPVLVPLRNTSRDFAETIGRLYYFKGDHADLARKMGLYFKDQLRNRLYLRSSTWDEATFQHMSERTGIPLEEWRSVFRLLDHYDKQTYVSEEQLIQLNKTLSRMRARL